MWFGGKRNVEEKTLENWDVDGTNMKENRKCDISLNCESVSNFSSRVNGLWPIQATALEAVDNATQRESEWAGVRIFNDSIA